MRGNWIVFATNLLNSRFEKIESVKSGPVTDQVVVEGKVPQPSETRFVVNLLEPVFVNNKLSEIFEMPKSNYLVPGLYSIFF